MLYMLDYFLFRSIFAGQLSAKMDSGTVWSEVYQDVNFSNYSLASLSEAGVLALGNIQGSVRFLKLDQNGSYGNVV